MKKALIARVYGGLGNQMFIYANARAISLRNNVPLILDTVTGFKNDPYERYLELDHFSVQYYKANTFESFNYPGGKIVRKVVREFNKRISRINYITEKNYEKYDPEIKNLKINHVTWIEGYWQTPFYFDDQEHIIRKELSTIITPISEESKKLAFEISKYNSVCIHARRLRNILVGEENAKIKTLTLEYYYSAIKKIAQSQKGIHFFCFSDSPEWLLQHLKVDYPMTVISHNSRNSISYEDVWLMQKCNHFIISNSTFAWWPAWLGGFADKIVIAPKLEYWDSKGILPKDWHII